MPRRASRLLAKRGRRDEARTTLAEIYNWFTEGFDTIDLKEAKALLGELEGAEGKTDEDIGTILGISTSTVRFHRNNIFKKLAANSRTYAITKVRPPAHHHPASIRSPVRIDSLRRKAHTRLIHA